MWLACLRMKALTHNLVIFNNHTAHIGIRPGAVLPLFGQLNGTLHIILSVFRHSINSHRLFISGIGERFTTLRICINITL